jgi:hypothetical protein
MIMSECAQTRKLAQIAVPLGMGHAPEFANFDVARAACPDLSGSRPL